MPDTSAPLPTRERILQDAAQLYVLRGHDGFSFGDVAALIGTTRANIHHHFGNKRRLMAELVERFTADAEARIARHWAAPGLTLAERFRSQREDLRLFYDRFNPGPGSREVWSPVARLRLDLPALGEPATTALERVNRAYDGSLRAALGEAAGRGELRPGIAVVDAARLLRVTFLSLAPITQDTGSFAEVEAALRGLERILVDTGEGRPAD